MRIISRAEKAKKLFNPSFFRLRWTAFGPITDVAVLDDATDAASPTTPFQTTSVDGTTILLHPLADEPLTLRPVATMSVELDALNYYSSSWWDFHIDDWEDEEEEKTDCPCGCERPVYQAPGPILVTPAAPDRSVVTIGDYVRQLHAWFNDHEEEVRLALRYGDEYRGLDFMVAVTTLCPDHVTFECEETGPEDMPRIWERRADDCRRRMEICALYADAAAD